jgi:hypothetical protein
MNEYQPTKPTKPLFLYIPISRLILLSIATFGIYETYWIYKNWRYIKERDGLNIKPFWRGYFGIFFCHSLLRRIYGDKEARTVAVPTFTPTALATVWVILAILISIVYSQIQLLNIATIILLQFIPTFLCFVPVQNYTNSITVKHSLEQRFYGWSSGHIVCLVYGIITWAMTFISLASKT